MPPGLRNGLSSPFLHRAPKVGLLQTLKSSSGISEAPTDVFLIKFGGGEHPLKVYENDLLELLNRNRGNKPPYTLEFVREAFDLLPPYFQRRATLRLEKLTRDKNWSQIMRLKNLNLYEEGADLTIALIRAKAVYYGCLNPDILYDVNRHVIRPMQERGASFPSLLGACTRYFRSRYINSLESDDDIFADGVKALKEDIKAYSQKGIDQDALIQMLALLAINLALYTEAWQELGLEQYTLITIVDEAEEVADEVQKILNPLYKKDREGQRALNFFRTFLDPRQVTLGLKDINLADILNGEQILDVGDDFHQWLIRRVPFLENYAIEIALSKQKARSALHYVPMPQCSTSEERKRISKLSELLEITTAFLKAMGRWGSKEQLKTLPQV